MSQASADKTVESAPAAGSSRPLNPGSSDAAEAILQDPHVSDQDRAFIARQVVQVTLPHADPGDVPVWKRSNGYLTLSIRPGWDHEKNCAARLSLRHAPALAAVLDDDRGRPHRQPTP